MDTDVVAGAMARHHIANLLYTYVDIADRKDVDAAVELFAHASVRFPAGGFDEPMDARTFFGSLWSAPAGHRHEVTNLRVVPVDDHIWRADAHYTRWVLDPDPTLHTLGEYALDVDDRAWTIRSLTVTRTWTKG